MKYIIISTITILLFSLNASSEEFKLTSPSGDITINISVTDQISYSVSFKNMNILQPSMLSMQLDNGISWGIKPKITKKEANSKSETIVPVVPRKFQKIESSYNFLRLTFKGNYQLEFRAYNDGVAYRWETDIKKEINLIIPIRVIPAVFEL